MKKLQIRITELYTLPGTDVESSKTHRNYTFCHIASDDEISLITDSVDYVINKCEDARHYISSKNETL